MPMVDGRVCANTETLIVSSPTLTLSRDMYFLLYYIEKFLFRFFR